MHFITLNISIAAPPEGHRRHHFAAVPLRDDAVRFRRRRANCSVHGDVPARRAACVGRDQTCGAGPPLGCDLADAFAPSSLPNISPRQHTACAGEAFPRPRSARSLPSAAVFLRIAPNDQGSDLKSCTSLDQLSRRRTDRNTAFRPAVLLETRSVRDALLLLVPLHRSTAGRPRRSAAIIPSARVFDQFSSSRTPEAPPPVPPRRSISIG